MTEDPLIRQCYPVTGDWFVVSTPECDRWFIERVVLWLLMRGEHQVSHVRALGSTGLPLDQDGGDSYFVYGPDASPAGVPWKELYDHTQPSQHNVREITDIMSGALAGRSA